MLDVDSGARSQLDVIPGAKYASPDWAPDSKSLVFASQVRGRETLYRVPVSGGAPVPLWTGGSVAGLESPERASFSERAL